MNIFQVMATVLNDTQPSEEEIQEIPPFIFCRYLASDPRCLGIANTLNLYTSIPVELQYRMVKEVLCGKLKYIRYLSTKDKDDEKDYKNLMKYYKISYEKAKDYMDYISESELNHINNIFQE